MTIIDRAIEDTPSALSERAGRGEATLIDGLSFYGWEYFVENPTTTPVSYRVTDLHPSCALSRAVTDLRTRFVEHQGWLTFEPGTSDHDYYDISPDTQVFASGIEVAESTDDLTGTVSMEPTAVNACMRLTRIDSAQGSLSFAMWGNRLLSEDFAAEYLSHEEVLACSAASGKLYDLTRLATDYESRVFESPEERHDAMAAAINNCFSMFGAGVAHTQDLAEYSPGYEGADAIWLFTINDSVRALLDITGIKYHVLVQDEISKGDGYTSSLCYLKVKDGLSQVANVPGFVDAQSLVTGGISNQLLIER